VKRSSVLALVLAGLTALCVVAACAGLVGVGPGVLLGCDVEATRAVPPVQDDPGRVASLFPRLGPVVSARWQIRDARPRTCPQVAPMTYEYDGLVTLAADPAGYAFTPSAPPSIPPGLAELAPTGASWQTSAPFDTDLRGTFHLDPSTHTLYFHTTPP
jgi:hypothetical protein